MILHHSPFVSGQEIGEMTVDPNKMPLMTLEEMDQQIAGVEQEMQAAINTRLNCEGALNVLRFQKQKMVDRLAAIVAANKINAEAAAETEEVEKAAEPPPKE